MTDCLDELITLRDAAALIGRKPVSLRSAVHRGTLRAVRVGRDWLTTRDNVAEYQAAVAEHAYHRQPQVIARKRRRTG